jgi:hypothetical protein
LLVHRFVIFDIDFVIKLMEHILGFWAALGSNIRDVVFGSPLPQFLVL